MAYTNRSIVFAIVSVFILVYSALYALTLYSVHQNGFSSEHFIVGSPGGDGSQYILLAHTLLENGRFSFGPTEPPDTFRTPGYPFFIALMLFLTGSIIFMPIGQIILTACSVALIFLVGARFFNRGIGLAAAVLFALDPYLSMVMFLSASDTLFVFVLLLSIYVLTVPERLGLSRAFCGGVLIGMLALVRPIGLYIFPLIVLWLLWEGRGEWKRALQTMALFLIGMGLVVVPWMARNYAHYGSASISSIGAYNLLFYNLTDFEHERTGISKNAVQVAMLKQMNATSTDPLLSLAFSGREKSVARTYLEAHPFQYAAYHLYKTIPFYIGSSIDAATEALHGRGVLQGALPLDVNVTFLILQGNYRTALAALTDSLPSLIERFMWLLLCLASFGITYSALHRRSANTSVILLFFGLIVAFGILTGPVSYARYRLPAEPFIFILGIAGILSAARYLKGLRFSHDRQY